MRVLESLEHIELIVYHFLVSLNCLLQDDLDGDLAVRAFSLANNAIGASTEGAAELVFGSMRKIWLVCLTWPSKAAIVEVLLLVVALGLTVKAVEHAGNYSHTAGLASKLYEQFMHRPETIKSRVGDT